MTDLSLATTWYPTAAPRWRAAARHEELLAHPALRRYDSDHSHCMPGNDRPPESAEPKAALSPETTVELLARARAGDRAAIERIAARCHVALRRWAHGRLPYAMRDIEDTADLVQDTIFATLKRLDRFDPRTEGALQAYLREALKNRIRDIIRRKMRRPAMAEIPDDVEAGCASPLEQAIGQQNLERYDAALARLRPADREAIVARIELQYSYEDLATALGKPSANAARVAVCRAVQRLADEMRRAC